LCGAARKKATPDHPWGRGKIEPLGALTIGGLLLATSAGIGYQAVTVMYDMLVVAPAAAATAATATTDATTAAVAVSGGLAAEMVSAGDSSSLAGQNFPLVAGLLDVPHVSYLQSAALGVSAVSVLAKEALYHYTLRAGQGAHSDAVKVGPSPGRCTVHIMPHVIMWPTTPSPNHLTLSVCINYHMTLLTTCAAGERVASSV